MVIGNPHANKYDKIFKENMEYALPGIIKNILGLNILSSEEITHDIQHTKERKPDVLRKVTDQNNRSYILHVELQSQNEKDMVYRMAEYRVMLQRKYHVPVKQYVLYVGHKKLTMQSSIDEEDFKFRYNIIATQNIDYKIFLNSDRPEEKILAILADFGEDPPEKVIEAIIDGVDITTDGGNEKDKYINQLEVLFQLRNLDLKYTDMLPKNFFKLEKSPFYIWGMSQGEIKGEARGEVRTKNKTALEMKKRGFELSLISDITDLPIEEIEKL